MMWVKEYKVKEKKNRLNIDHSGSSPSENEHLKSLLIPCLTFRCYIYSSSGSKCIT